MFVESTAFSPVFPYVLVDCLDTYRLEAFLVQLGDYLLRAKIVFNQLPYPVPLLGRELGSSASAVPFGNGIGVGDKGRVNTSWPLVALKFAGHGAGRTS